MNSRRLLIAPAAAIALAALTALPVLPAPAASTQTGRADLYEDVERPQALVVRLTSPNTEGAGILVHADAHYAYGITAKHVVYQQGKLVPGLKAQFRAWPGPELPVEVPKLHHQEDLAVFRADLRSLGLSLPEILRAIPLDLLGDSTGLDPGDALSCVGHSTAGAWINPKEPVRFARGDGGNGFLFEFDCPQGHSGGAVYDEEWRLVGMMTDEERPYCRALRIEPVLKILQGWKVEISLRVPPSRQRDHQAADEITVAVVDFDNRSTKDLPQLGFVAQDITSSYLHTLPGVVLVTRDRLDSVRKEIRLPASVETGAGISRLGQLLNADALVTGSVLRYDVERRTFEGFGTSALQDVFRMEISLQILDVETGRVRFSKAFEVERTKQYPKATSAPPQPIDLTTELLRALLDQAQNDIRSALAQVAAGLGTANQFVQVRVTSTPAGADVISNGIYMGKTPLTLQLTLGEHELAIELAGHESWRRRVAVQPGKSVDVALVPRRR